MKTRKDKKDISYKTDFFERFGLGEHLIHPSFALGDEDFEGISN